MRCLRVIVSSRLTGYIPEFHWGYKGGIFGLQSTIRQRIEQYMKMAAWAIEKYLALKTWDMELMWMDLPLTLKGICGSLRFGVMD